MKKSGEPGTRRFVLWLLIPVITAGVVAAAGYVIVFVPLVYPPMPPPPPGQEYVLPPTMKITLSHYIHLRLHPPPPLTGAD